MGYTKFVKVEDPHHIDVPHQKWSFQGLFGTYDKAALQRGFQVYTEVCAACHSMKLLSYRNLTSLGFSMDEVKAIAAAKNVTDGPNDSGDMFDRPARPSDRFVSPYANDKQARAANGGALPPDMSLIAKARKGGPDYITALISHGYQEAPQGFSLIEGLHYNKFFPGNQIGMKPPLAEGQVTFADGTPSTVEQMAKDVSHFLMWAADPHMTERKQTGIKVLLFLILFTGLLYASKVRIWSRLKG